MSARTRDARRDACARTAASLSLNVVSSIGVILVNKQLVYGLAGFHFGTVLTLTHFALIFVWCEVLARRGVLLRSHALTLRRVFALAAVFCGHVVCNNMSLLTNTIDIYQLSKIACTPVIVLLEARQRGSCERVRVLLALALICCGVAFTFCVDVSVNVAGVCWASIAVMCNSLYTVWSKRVQTELRVSALQLLHYQAGVSALLLCLVALPLDGVAALRAYRVTVHTVWALLLSCVFAFGVNFSFFVAVRQTSPLTMNVLGYLKTVLVLVLGALLREQAMSAQAACGVVVTLVGLALYTALKTMQMQSSSSSGSALSTMSATRGKHARHANSDDDKHNKVDDHDDDDDDSGKAHGDNDDDDDDDDDDRNTTAVAVVVR